MFKNKSNNKAISKILNSKRLGLLINDRFINLPEILITPAMKFVINEISECVEIINDKTNKINDTKEKEKYNLDYVIIFGRYIKKDEDNFGNFDDEIEVYKEEKMFKKQKGNNINNIKDGNEIFYKYEMENYLKNCDYFFDYKLNTGIYGCNEGYIYNKSDINLKGGDSDEQFMKVILINFNKFCIVTQNLQ